MVELIVLFVEVDLFFPMCNFILIYNFTSNFIILLFGPLRSFKNSLQLSLFS